MNRWRSSLLAKTYGGELGPKTPAEDGLMTKLVVLGGDGGRAHTIDILYHRLAKPPEERDAAKADAAVAALKKPFAVLTMRWRLGLSSASASPSPTSTSPRSSAMRNLRRNSLRKPRM